MIFVSLHVFTVTDWLGQVELKVYFGKVEPLKSVSKISLCYLQALKLFCNKHGLVVQPVKTWKREKLGDGV